MSASPQVSLPPISQPKGAAPAQKPAHLPGTKGDPQKKSLFSAAEEVINYTPAIGTEIVGLQLKDLNEQQLEDLALLIAERGVVFFRDQDLTVQQQRELGAKWGRLNNRTPHPVEGTREVQTFRTDENSKQAPDYWHQDHSADEEPATITFLVVREVPKDGGGDTLWSSLYSAYDKLSPAFRAKLEGLETLQEGAYYPTDASYVPARGIQPLIRTHPVTGWKILYVNQAWVKQIKGFTRAESDLLLKYLNDHVARGVEFQVRFKWTKNSVALWDNRSTQHTATWDFFPETRWGTRVVVHGDKSFFDPASKSRNEALGIPDTPSWRADVANSLEDIAGRNSWGIKFTGDKKGPFKL
ncbi:TauD-domain-containing protein [Gonapodya prolifera JEL478]|uniref:TauD-domain-containing protein n=1 Tax=Gonapodya prolifera (strain JEL478) TaxID=1344416 RepID=A0A139AM96_GONPJ|nr:TauD-domain-containing protein [Gonapodya prolifera JEL478]|eukprot:KXS17891.1 TauD-domain-containing protein [Gonapodya prolifera JEL478]